VDNIFPASFTAGLTFSKTIALDDYPASEGWALSAALRGASVINLTATVEDGQHKLTASATTTGGWLPGRYSYNVRVSKASEVFEVEAGTIEILPNLNAQVAGYDGRTHAERTLEAIKAVIEQRASLDQEQYRINNRELRRTPIAELIQLRDLYQSEVNSEKLRARGGNQFGRAVRVIL
jgi:hypothetical protein